MTKTHKEGREMNFPQSIKNDAARLKAYFPYRNIWLVNDSEGAYLICKPTAHKVNAAVKKGAKAWKLS